MWIDEYDGVWLTRAYIQCMYMFFMCLNTLYYFRNVLATCITYVLCCSAFPLGVTIVSLLDGVCTILYIIWSVIFPLIWMSLITPGMNYRYSTTKVHVDWDHAMYINLLEIEFRHFCIYLSYQYFALPQMAE